MEDIYHNVHFRQSSKTQSITFQNIDTKFIRSRTFVNCGFYNPLVINAEDIETSAFVSCTFHHKVILQKRFSEDIFENCTFMDGYTILGVNKNIDNIITPDNSNISTGSFVKLTPVDSVLTTPGEPEDISCIQDINVEVLHTGAYKCVRFTQDLVITCREANPHAFIKCIFTQDVVVQIEVYSEEIFEDCIFLGNISYIPYGLDPDPYPEPVPGSEPEPDRSMGPGPGPYPLIFVGSTLLGIFADRFITL